ncbi:MAG: hypothetical protein Q4E16_02245 [Neisseria sp.]|nr:hypothetical protein [Neisseria sp.]
MNIYDDFFKGITPEDWEFFALDFLGAKGFEILSPPARGADGGKDLIVAFQNKKFIVSCKHFIHRNKSVGIEDEQSISDRLIQHDAQGFIGFYSTLVSQSLQNRLEALHHNNGYSFIIFDKNTISDYIPSISCWILQKYGLPELRNYFYLNVPKEDYKPLPCLCCGTDIINDDMIKLSMAGFALNNDGSYSYIYGCKYCIGDYCNSYYLDHLQALYIEQLIGWDRVIADFTEQNKIDGDFYKNYLLHRSALMQRLYPSHLGMYPTALIQW